MSDEPALLRAAFVGGMRRFLCGSSGSLDPRVERAVEIGVRLCIP